MSNESVKAVVPAAQVESIEERAVRTSTESTAALTRARAVLEEMQARKLAWDEQEAEARTRLAAAGDELKRRELALREAQRAHEESLHGAHAAAAQRGHDEGLARGIAEGRSSAATAVSSRIDQLDVLARAMRAASADMFEHHEDMLVDVAWTAICRLAGELAISRAGTLAMVRVAVAQFKAASAPTIRVHPQDAEWLCQQEKIADWSLQSDPTVELGGCIVESAQGSLDARLELQLERLRRALYDARAVRLAQGPGGEG